MTKDMNIQLRYHKKKLKRKTKKKLENCKRKQNNKIMSDEVSIGTKPVIEGVDIFTEAV